MKTCFKCQKSKPMSEYYKHAQMSDGYLNKCKECTKIDSNKLYKKKIENPEFAELERIRARERYYRLYKGTKSKSKNRDQKYSYPEKYIARYKSRGIKLKGYESHHWSYAEENYKKVIFLTHKDHQKLHRYLVYNNDLLCYNTKNGWVLDTIEKHIEIIEILGLEYKLPF